MDHPVQATPDSPPRWRPLSATDRRVLGVLAEKAKTTPDVYPMTVNAIRSGANQKNNRYPLSELEIEDIEESLERLRGVGAVTEVQGGSRVPRFKHHLYDWLGVDKVELAVMTELLLRGAQTEGELRGRAARMDPIADVAALRVLLASLGAKGLIVSLTPDGRGHVLTHALYEPRELERLRAEHQGLAAAAGYASPAPSPSQPAPSTARPSQPVPEPLRHAAAPAVATTDSTTAIADAREALRSELAELRAEVEQLRSETERLRRDFDDLAAQLR